MSFRPFPSKKRPGLIEPRRRAIKGAEKGNCRMTGDEALERAYAELLNFADEEERQGNGEKAGTLRFAEDIDRVAER